MTYVIVTTREFYGPETRRSLVMTENGQRARTFATLAAARAHISDLDSEPYYTAHNESSRPSYKARRVAGLPAYLAQMA